MRGKATARGLVRRRPRITPARAGKSPPLLQTHSNRGDHPRACGEKSTGLMCQGGEIGSPPHTRGKALVLPHCPGVPGITPAHAGKRSRSLIHSPGREDHPRTRGEKFLIFTKRGRKMGSPPHTRGKVRALRDVLCVHGITPAHAGKSGAVDVGAMQMRDHPRTRGEKLSSTSRYTALLGSPPHTRGKAYRSTALCRVARITPAHAGKRQELLEKNISD